MQIHTYSTNIIAEDAALSQLCVLAAALHKYTETADGGGVRVANRKVFYQKT